MLPTRRKQQNSSFGNTCTCLPYYSQINIDEQKIRYCLIYEILQSMLLGYLIMYTTVVPFYLLQPFKHILHPFSV
uniref:Uncharacterized protein MANES_09G026800 n=1 Tax=Rhizophora mucronata TaxID=61149 RepID=A0A2P2L6A9_RHIMU